MGGDFESCLAGADVEVHPFRKLLLGEAECLAHLPLETVAHVRLPETLGNREPKLCCLVRKIGVDKEIATPQFLSRLRAEAKIAGTE